MTKDKWTVGQDRDTPGTIRTTLMGEASINAARVYAITKYPEPYERVHEVNGRLIEVIVREKVKE